MKKDRYLLPQITDLLDSPCKARFYSKIDLWHTYHLIRIQEGDEWKTTFRTHYRSFEWCVMPFGLTNAPAVFQHLMNNVFLDLLNICILVCLDNILIHFDILEEHRRYIREVLLRRWNNKLYAHGDKCSFLGDTIEYLGFILSPNSLSISPGKVSTILEWPELCKVKDIQSFLGFANCYRRFISDYSKIIVLLTHLTRKGTLWDFSDACQSSFKSLKAFTTALVLARWNPGDPLIVETDMSDYALGAILSTIDPLDNQVHPIAFHARTLLSTGIQTQ